MNEGNSGIAIRILEWMACSFTPLKFYEILDGIALSPSCTLLSDKTRVHRDALNLCQPLVEDCISGTVEFVHFSAKR